ncbi:MAG: hypothetical protein N3G22_03565 [Candidatus Micrarchaeota archaeon]|nr:hypothetical protein [Candidatus Micrarchaeota archaeon]
MTAYAIIKLEADAIAMKEDIVAQFNSYLQQSAPAPSFVHESEGYFRISYDDEFRVSSAGIVEFGKFLESSGYAITGINNSAPEGKNSTEVVFTKGSREGRVFLSTVNIY